MTSAKKNPDAGTLKIKVKATGNKAAQIATALGTKGKKLT